MAHDTDGHLPDPYGRIAGHWYADRFRIGHTAFQFKLDCGHEEQQAGEVQLVYMRIVTDPSRARELFRELGLSLLRYADAFGRIDDDEGDAP